MRNLFIGLLAIAVCAVVVMGAAPAVAQESTPGASPADIIGVPDPSECTVEPRSFEDLQSVIATPVAEEDAAVASPAAPALPEGDAAGPETTAEVLAALQEGVACINAGQLIRLLALYSDELVRELLAPQGGLTQEQYDELTAGQPLPDDQRTEIIEVQGVVTLEDGRVAALITGDDRADPRPASPTLFIFDEQDGAWIIDDFVSTPDDGTPTP